MIEYKGFGFADRSDRKQRSSRFKFGEHQLAFEPQELKTKPTSVLCSISFWPREGLDGSRGLRRLVTSICQQPNQLAAGQPIRADRADSAVAPELNELLYAEYASQILAGEAIDGMAARFVRQNVPGLPGNVGFAYDI